MPDHACTITALLAEHPVVLAPMEDVSDAPFRRVCRALGAVVCVTEFVRAEQLITGGRNALRKARLTPDDSPTGIQIYGADPQLLFEAAAIAAAAQPTFIDINCGCWVPRVVAGGAGAAWLRDPGAMVAMARGVVDAVDLPVTVKTRIGFGPESHMPIVDLARRLEDAGIAALSIHCRTAQMGHSGAADWRWAERARRAVAIPVIVNGDVSSAQDAVRALHETGCAGVMIGRAALEQPWIFREAQALLDGVPGRHATPDGHERLALYRTLLAENVAARGDKYGVEVTRRHLRMLGPALHQRLRQPLCAAKTFVEVCAVLDGVAALDLGASNPKLAPGCA